MTGGARAVAVPPQPGAPQWGRLRGWALPEEPPQPRASVKPFAPCCGFGVGAGCPGHPKKRGAVTCGGRGRFAAGPWGGCEDAQAPQHPHAARAVTPGVAGSLEGWGRRMSLPPAPSLSHPQSCRPQPGAVPEPFPGAVLPSPGSGAVLQPAASAGTGPGRATAPPLPMAAVGKGLSGTGSPQPHAHGVAAGGMGFVGVWGDTNGRWGPGISVPSHRPCTPPEPLPKPCQQPPAPHSTGVGGTGCQPPPHPPRSMCHTLLHTSPQHAPPPTHTPLRVHTAGSVSSIAPLYPPQFQLCSSGERTGHSR